VGKAGLLLRGAEGGVGGTEKTCNVMHPMVFQVTCIKYQCQHKFFIFPYGGGEFDNY